VVLLQKVRLHLSGFFFFPSRSLGRSFLVIIHQRVILLIPKLQLGNEFSKTEENKQKEVA
jgi:hypothetical protein